MAQLLSREQTLQEASLSYHLAKEPAVLYKFLFQPNLTLNISEEQYLMDILFLKINFILTYMY
jgi:hypothetical protein